MGEIEGLDPRDLVLSPQFGGHQAGDDVGFVRVGDGDEQVAGTHPRPLQNGRVHGVALDGFDAEFLAEVVEHRLVVVNAHDFHALAVQGAHDVVPYLPRTDDHNAHAGTPLLIFRRPR